MIAHGLSIRSNIPPVDIVIRGFLGIRFTKNTA